VRVFLVCLEVSYGLVSSPLSIHDGELGKALPTNQELISWKLELIPLASRMEPLGSSTSNIAVDLYRMSCTGTSG
jgi:hypothetical protein